MPLNDRVPGEIVGLSVVDCGEGVQRLVAEVVSPSGEIHTGVLTAPPRGMSGAIAFEPVPGLAELVYPDGHPEPVKVENGPDANDPRGLRGGRTRQAGMKA